MKLLKITFNLKKDIILNCFFNQMFKNNNI